jgi:hypothetical protein
MNVIDHFCCCNFPNPQVLMSRYVNKYQNHWAWVLTAQNHMLSLLQILLCMSCCFHQWRITLSKIIDGKPAFLGKVISHLSPMLKDSTLAEGTARPHTATLTAPQFVFKCLMTTSPFILFPTATPWQKMIVQIFSSHPPTLRSGPLPLALSQIFFSTRIDSQRFYLTFGFLSATLSHRESERDTGQGRICTSYFNPTLSIMGQ